jgi:polar amino acid transport system substrate-binding protein
MQDNETHRPGRVRTRSTTTIKAPAARFVAFKAWAVSLALAWCIPVWAEELIVYGDDNYAPVIHVRAGKPAGALVDLLRKVSERTGDTYTVQLFPWKRAFETAREGRGALIGVSLNAERATVFDFSDPVYNDDIQIVTRKGHEFAFEQLTDLKGKVLGGVLGASYGEQVDAAIRDGVFKVDRDVSQVNRLNKLLAGRMDAALIGNGIEGFESVLQADPQLAAKRGQFSILAKPLTRDPLYLAIPKSMGKKPVLDRFNKAVRELQKSGALRRVTP